MSLRLAWFVGILALDPALGLAESPTKFHTNSDGTPLPDGAVARLGSSRFRIDGRPAGLVTFSPDGKLLAVGGVRFVYVFETATGQEHRRFPIPAEHSYQVARFLNDGSRIAICTAGTTTELVFFRLADGKPMTTARLPGGNQVLVSDVTADGSRVLAMDWAARIYVWDVRAKREVWSLAHARPDSATAFTSDGKHFVLAGRQGAALHDAETGKVVNTFPVPGPGFSNRELIGMSPDGRLAVAADRGDAVVILAAQGAGRLRRLPSAHLGGRFVFSPDSRYLIAPDTRGTQVWDLNAVDEKGPVKRLPGARTAGFSPDGTILAVADDGAISLRTVGDWKPLPQSSDPGSPVFHVAFSADGKSVIGYTRPGWVSWPTAGGPATRISDGSPVHAEGLADISEDGSQAVDLLHEPGPEQHTGALSGKYTVRVTDLVSGKDRRFPLGGHTWEPVQLSPDGRHVAASIRGSEFVIWESTTGAVLHRHKEKAGSVLFGAMVAPDGKGLAGSAVGVFGSRGLGDGPMYSSVTVTDHRTGRDWKMDPIPWSVYSSGARFSRDGSRLVVMGRWAADPRKDRVTVWDNRTGRRLVNWEREAAPLESVSLSLDNRSLLTGDRRGTLALIEVATGVERMAFRHTSEVLSADFNRDGTRAVSSSPDGPVYVWDLIGRPGKWDTAKADAVWTDLMSTDAKVAFSALRWLRANPANAIPMLRDRLKVPTAPTDESIGDLVKRLDGPRFTEREQAQKELIAVAQLVRPRLEAARKTASEEAARRLDQVLKAADSLTPDQLRHVRACEVLEGIGAPEAVTVLRHWASGPEGARLTVEAKESLARLK
jgi:WD40 repeat protein